MTSDIMTLTLTTTRERHCRHGDRRRLGARATVMDLGRIELARRRGALTHNRVLGRRVDGNR